MEALEARLGYTFRDRSLLENALMHSSYANENRAHGYTSNERLEFLGDSVLGMVTATRLYRLYPDMPEGKMSRLRAELVCEQALHGVACTLHLGDYIRLGHGEERSGGRERPSILADAVEAVIAAMYLDGGLEPAQRFILAHILNGLSVGEDGATHQCTEDLALMRVIPGMKVLCPCDGYEMKLAVKALLEYDGPAYLRLGRAAVETVTDEIEDYRFELDKGVTLKDGKDVTVIATGLMVQMALKAREMMAAEGVSVRVIDMHTIKPLDGELVRKAALETGCIVTSEEHSIIGGLGGAVAEFLSENCPTPLVRHGVNDAFGRSGTANAVLEAYGLTPEVLCDKIREALAKKH